VFSIAANGTLSPITGSPFAVTGASQVVSVAVDPTDKYLYAVDSPTPAPPNGSVYAFNVVSGGGISATPAIAGSPKPSLLTSKLKLNHGPTQKVMNRACRPQRRPE